MLLSCHSYQMLFQGVWKKNSKHARGSIIKGQENKFIIKS